MLCRTALAAALFAKVSSAQTADLVVTNAHIYTVDPQRPSATGLAVRGNRIVGVSDDVSAFIGPNTKKIDAHGRAVVPGLIDSHGHMAALGAELGELDLRGIASVNEIGSRVAGAAKKAKPGEWIRGHAWDQNLWPDKAFPTRTALDSAAPDNPVVLGRVDGHAIWVNTRALTLADVNAATKAPPGGKIIRDQEGRPTGVLVDNAMSLVADKVPRPSRDQLAADLERAAQVCVRDGLTTVHDAGIGADQLDAYRELIAQNRLPMRIYAMIHVGLRDRSLWNTFKARGPEIGERLTVRSLKLIADGALGSRGAAMLEPYSDDPGNSGLLILNREFIEATAREAIKAGFQVNTHAIGDRANRVTLQAYEAALGGKNDKRFRVEHAQIVAPEDFARFRDNSIIASMQPTHATSDMPWAALRVGGQRIEGGYAWERLIRLGVHVASGSDFPVEDPNPIWGFYSAITRQDHAGNPAGGWFPDERMTRAQALRSWTIEGAYAAFEEDRKGSLTPGKLADFVMLSDDIMQIPKEQVWKARVAMTVMDGKIVFEE